MLGGYEPEAPLPQRTAPPTSIVFQLLLLSLCLWIIEQEERRKPAEVPFLFNLSSLFNKGINQRRWKNWVNGAGAHNQQQRYLFDSLNKWSWRKCRQFFPFFDWKIKLINHWSPRNSMEIEWIGAEGRRQLLQRREGRRQATNPIKQQLNCAVWWMVVRQGLLISLLFLFAREKREKAAHSSPIQSSISFNTSFLLMKWKVLMKWDWMELPNAAKPFNSSLISLNCPFSKSNSKRN